MRDRYKRKINYLRMSITHKCNLGCKYCMPHKNNLNKDKELENELSIEDIETIAKTFVSIGVDKIRLTGGEPLARKEILPIVRRISSLKGVKDLSITTNGILLKKYAKDLKEAGLNRVNISLDTLDGDKYSEITQGGDISNVLEGIEEAKKVGLFPIKLNVVLINKFNENEIKNFIELTINEDIDVRFIELMPIGKASKWSLDRYISNEVVLDSKNNLVKVEDNEPWSTAQYYKVEGAKGKVGIINPISHKFCDYCNRVRVTSDGKLKLCLHSNNEIDLKEYLDDESKLKEKIQSAMTLKPKSHHLEDGEYISKSMSQIGG